MGMIAENLRAVKAKITEIRPNAELIAVSKTHAADKIREAIQAGQLLFGENRVQEALSKFPDLKKEFPQIKLHLIGPLQTNKVKDALALFDVIQTVDREKLARELASSVKRLANSQTPDARRIKEFFILVNIGEEPQKAGIAPQQAEEFYKFCTEELKLNITGLMCIPPVDEPAFMYFALLKNIAFSVERLANPQTPDARRFFPQT